MSENEVSVRSIGKGALAQVLIHGFASNSGTFQNLLPALLLRGAVILVDLPGHGRSKVPSGKVSARSLAAPIEKRLRTSGFEQLHLIGHSLGGILATEVALAMPERVKRLSLISCAGVGPDLNLPFFHSFLSVQSPEELLPHLSVAYSGEAAEPLKAANVTYSWLQKPGVREFLRQLVLTDVRFSAKIDAAIAKNLQVSALWGSEDRITPFSNARFLPPEVPLTVVRGAGHLPHIERPAEVAAWLDARS